MPEVIDTTPEDDPELAELQQREYARMAVMVKHDGPVQVHDLPSRTGVMRSINLDTTLAQPIASADLGRKALLLYAADGDFYVGTSRSSVLDGSAALWPQGIPLDIRHTDALFARGATAATRLTVISELWAYAG